MTLPSAARSIPSFSRFLSREEIYSRICVRDPYFALEDVTVMGEGRVAARVPIEQPLGQEIGPIGGAEAGRHLAILGCCAASQINPREGRHYYLAKSADLRRTDFDASGVAGMLLGRAEAEFTGKRSCAARTELFRPDGTRIYTLDVAYHVLPENAFQRLFESARRDMRRAPRPSRGEWQALQSSPVALRANPYRKEIPFAEVEIRGGSICATLPELDAELCKGHFAMYPMLPVAVVMHGLSDVAGRLLSARLGIPGARYFVHKGAVRSEHLAHAGQTVAFHAQHLREDGREHEFFCRAITSGGNLAGEMELTLTATQS